MSRLFSTIRLDMTIQLRNQIYTIAVGLALVVGVLLFFGLERALLSEILPLLLLSSVGGTTLVYVMGLLIFEKEQHTLAAQIVTPLRIGEYLYAKLISLTVVALLESLLLVALAWGVRDLNWFYLLGGCVLLGLMLAQVGIILIVRYESFTDALIPMLFVTIPLLLPPFLHMTGLLASPFWYVMPTLAPTILLYGAWRELPLWQIAYAIIYSLLTIVILHQLSLHAFRRHIVEEAKL